MSTDPSANPHEPNNSPEDEELYLHLPMYLVDGEEMDDLLHPEIAITRRVNAPPDDPGVESIIFRQEDYNEPGDENWDYGGLVFLDPAVYEYDEDLTPEELEEARASEPEAWDYPEKVACPGCGGEATWLDGTTGEDSCPYMCGDCSRMMLLERRPSLRNAAVLMVSRFVPDQE